MMPKCVFVQDAGGGIDRPDFFTGNIIACEAHITRCLARWQACRDCLHFGQDGSVKCRVIDPGQVAESLMLVPRTSRKP
jgi:hypothetical protein